MGLAVLDVGSNTVHLVVVDGQPDGTFGDVAAERNGDLFELELGRRIEPLAVDVT